MYQSAKQYLLNCSIRITPARDAVLRTIIKHTMPLTVAQIQDYSGYDANEATFYRIVKTFVQAGLLKEVSFRNIVRYELSDLFLPHHHHLTCVSCGRIEDISDTTIEKAIDNIGKSYSFKIESHTFELKGVCHECV